MKTRREFFGAVGKGLLGLAALAVPWAGKAEPRPEAWNDEWSVFHPKTSFCKLDLNDPQWQSYGVSFKCTDEMLDDMREDLRISLDRLQMEATRQYWEHELQTF